MSEHSTDKDAPFVERVGDQHFPWHYTEVGVLCACGRPCDRDEECAVVHRARRWEASTTRVIPPLTEWKPLMCEHEWTDRGSPGDRWRECWLCGTQEDSDAEA